jgi:hypothetical protein
MSSGDQDSRRTTGSGLRVLGPEARPLSAAPPPKLGQSRYGAGDVIADRYRLGRKLGEGGMGEVWLAHNETLDIDVAIKLIRGEIATPEMAERLLHEARAAARLGHPSIVRVNDFGSTGRGDPYIVMELLDGEDLATTLAKRGRLSPIKAIRTLLPIAHALTVAHTKGIVHRDLKPENVFLARNDEGQIHPKLVDFGVAKLEKVHSNRLTQSGALLGSPLYMSPEQARGDDVDHRADIWAFAVVLYETVAGRPPFDGKNYNAIIYSIIANPAAPITDIGVGDADLWAILDRGFQKDPDRRWYSMRDFGEALARWLVDRGIQDDIGGASLSANWLQWKKDEDALAAAPQGIDAQSGALPPVPNLGRATTGPRQRVTTLRVPRDEQAEQRGAASSLFGVQRRRTIVIAAACAAVAIFGLVFWLVSRSSDAPSEVAASETPASPAPAASAPPAPVEAPKPSSPEHERAIAEALSASQGTRAAPEHPVTKKPAAEPKKTAGSGAKGIRPSDPYGGKTPSRPGALKNPFQ